VAPKSCLASEQLRESAGAKIFFASSKADNAALARPSVRDFLHRENTHGEPFGERADNVRPLTEPGAGRLCAHNRYKYKPKFSRD
jgi:hypothetical protein